MAWRAPLAAVLLALGASGNVSADELSDAIAAAEKASAAAKKAASTAMSAASAARANNDTAKAASAAMDAGTAAREAAEAAEALAKIAKSATMSSDAAPAETEAAPAAAATDSAAQVAAVSSAASGGGKPYEDHIQCEGRDCKIDLYLTRGFRAFSQCQVCHGLDANGSSFAPSLVEKLQEIDRARFMDVVINGYKGQVGVMPPWKTNPNVMKVLDNLYAYLMARSDKRLPAGKLKRYDR